MTMSLLLDFALRDDDTTNLLLVLNPKEKMAYFKKHWSVELQGEVVKCAEEVVCYMFRHLPMVVHVLT